MARVVAPKSPNYDELSTEVKRQKRISELGKKTTFSPQERDEALRLLLEDFTSRNTQP